MAEGKTGRSSAARAMELAAIMSLFMCSSAGGFESAAVQSCIEAWPDVSPAAIRMMLTLPALVQAAVMPLMGRIAGRRLRYRSAALAGMALIALGGCIPALFAPDWGFVLFCRGLGLGVGGALLGIRSALLLESVPGEQAGKWMGRGSACVALMSVVCSPLCGLLASGGWSRAFYINALAAAGFLLCLLFLREPEHAARESASAAEPRRSRLDGRLWPLAGVIFVSTCMLYSAISCVSTFFAENGIGSAALAGVCISAYSVAGVGINLLLGPLQRVLGKRLPGVCALTCALGLGLMLVCPGFVTSVLGFAIAGIGYFPIYSMVQVYNSRIQRPEALAFSSVVLLTSGQLAVFASSGYITLAGRIFSLGSEVSGALLGAVLLFIPLGAAGLTGRLAA